MSSKTLICKNWNFDLDKPIGIYKDSKSIKKNQHFFIVNFNDQNKLESIEHKLKTSFFNKRVELFTFDYDDNKLLKRSCFDRFSRLKWYNQIIHDDNNQLERCETYIKHLDKNDYELLNYSLYYYDNNGYKNLRKILDAKSNLNCYEVFHYEGSRLIKKEMFNQDNEKIMTEMFNYDNEGKLTQIDCFDADGNHDRSIAMEVYI